jgi:hypothetical protein
MTALLGALSLPLRSTALTVNVCLRFEESGILFFRERVCP